MKHRDERAPRFPSFTLALPVDEEEIDPVREIIRNDLSASTGESCEHTRVWSRRISRSFQLIKPSSTTLSINENEPVKSASRVGHRQRCAWPRIALFASRLCHSVANHFGLGHCLHASNGRIRYAAGRHSNWKEHRSNRSATTTTMRPYVTEIGRSIYRPSRKFSNSTMWKSTDPCNASVVSARRTKIIYSNTSPCTIRTNVTRAGENGQARPRLIDEQMTSRFYCDSSSDLDEHISTHKSSPLAPEHMPIPLSSSILTSTKLSEPSTGGSSERSSASSKAKLHRCRQCPFVSSVKVQRPRHFCASRKAPSLSLYFL